MTLISRGLHSQGLLDTLPSAIKETHKENVFVKLTGNTLRSVYMVEYKICTPATQNSFQIICSLKMRTNELFQCRLFLKFQKNARQ